MSSHRLIPTALLAACVLANAAAAAAPAPVAGPPSCRELERRFEQTKADATSTQLNLALFAAADSGCVPLARLLLAAGASLEARDRLGAMALARAARAGHVPLVELFLAQGAAIDARNLTGTTPLYGAAENRRPSRCCWPRAPIRTCRAGRASRRSRRRRSRATAASSTS